MPAPLKLPSRFLRLTVGPGFWWGLLSLGLVITTLPAGEEPGTLSGLVRYRARTESPWRFQRYYVADSRTVGLSEAVVALTPKTPSDSISVRKPETKVMDQENFQFVPETIAIQVGDTVRFTNSDETLHNIMLSKGRDAFNVNLAKGEVYDHEFKEATSPLRPHRLGCVYHGSMQAWVFVLPNPFFAVTGKDGTFRFQNLPPGTYQLLVHHPAGRYALSQEIEIIGGTHLERTLELSPDHTSGKLITR